MKTPDLGRVKETLKMTDYPIQLVLEAANSCNLRCQACPYSVLKREKGVMSAELYKKIVDEIAENSPEQTNLWFAFMGEPTTLGKRLFEMVKYAKEKGIRNTLLNTNATLIDDEMIDWVFDSSLDKIYVSIDAATEDSYNKIRVGGDFSKVRSNVAKLLEERKKRSSEKPEIIVQFIIMEENASEERAFKDYWLEKGAVVKIRRKMGWGGKIESKDLDIPQSGRNMPCPWLMRQMIVLWNGRVAQCDADYEGQYCAGDANNQTIFEIWNGELKEKRQKHIQSDFNFLPCKECNDWQVGLSEYYYPKK